MDWDDIDPSALFDTVREDTPPADAERMVWALERMLEGGRIDPSLLDHLAVAAICALAYRDGDTPRGVLEKLFRRSITDDHWQSRYASLIGTPT